MTRSVDEQGTTSGSAVPGPRTAAELPTEPAAVAEEAPGGDPSLIGLPLFIVGAVGLGLVLVGFVPAASGGAAIPIIMTATGVGLLVAALWAARLAQNAVAGVFAIFSGFWISYAALVLGLGHNWFGIATADVTRSVELFLIAWLVGIGLLTLGSVRLPLIYTVLFALVEVALLLDLLGTANASTGLVTTAGWVVFLFTALGAYLFLSSMSTATGGRPYPMGRPIVS
jgi:succinate-acetate transporter protein